MVRHFRELRVYRDAFAAAMKIFQLSKSWAQEERYALTDQIRRASRSVSTNIAEAWRKRRYPAHFTSKLSDADSETAETQAWLDYAHSCGYLSKEQFSNRADFSLDQILSETILKANVPLVAPLRPLTLNIRIASQQGLFLCPGT